MNRSHVYIFGFAIRQWIVVAALLATSCGTKSEVPELATLSAKQDSSFATAVPHTEMNSIVSLRIAQQVPETPLKMSVPITVWVENQSQETVLFPTDFGVMIVFYSVEDFSWKEIKNNTNYLTISAQNLLAPKGVMENDKGFFWRKAFSFLPHEPRLQPPITIRLVVRGSIIKEGLLGEAVGAYLDIELEP